MKKIKEGLAATQFFDIAANFAKHGTDPQKR
jgi:hypothetical protein